MRLPPVIEVYIPDVTLTPIRIHCPIITDTFPYVVGIYLLFIKNTSSVIGFLLASLIPPETVLPAHLLQVLGIDSTQIPILNP